MRAAALKETVRLARRDFEARVHQIAAEARKRLLPYFQKRGWSYVAGNGGWFITDHRGRQIEDDRLPAHVRDILWIEVEYGRYLGYYICEIKP